MELTQEYFDQQLGGLATKKDLEQLASKADVEELRSEFQEIKADVTALQDDVRLVKSTLSGMNQTLTAIDQRDREDSNAFAKILVKHDEQLEAVEQEVKQLKLKRA